MLNIDATRIRSRAYNWGRWASSGVEDGHCASVEHRYVAPRPDGEEVVRIAEGKVDVDDAERFERAVCTLQYPQDKLFMRLMYCEGRPAREIERKLKIPVGLLEAFHHRVLGALMYRCEQLESMPLRRSIGASTLRSTI